MKIVFICPTAKDNHFMIEPLSVGYLSSYLKSKGYNDIELYFGAFTKEKDIALKCAKADIVGFSTASPHITQGIRIANLIKKQNPNVVTVVGGSHATALPERTLKQCLPIDVVVRGEAEETFYELIKAIEDKKDFSHINGITYRKGKEIISNPNVKLIQDIDKIPHPDRELMKQDMFIKMNLKIGKKISWMMATRGCPFICNFCASKVVWGITYRKRSPKDIVDEMRELYLLYNVNHINFADDTLTIDKKWTHDLCQEIIDSGMKISWSCNSQTSTVTREMLFKMKEAGCEQIWFGVESGNPKIRRDMEKYITNESIINAFNWSKEAGIKTRAHMIVGGPNETYETIKDSEELLDIIKPDIVGWSINTILPGLEVYNKAVKEGVIKEDEIDWAGVGFRNPHDAILPSKYLTNEEIVSEWRRLSEKYKEYKLDDTSYKYIIEYLFFRLFTTNLFEYPRIIKKLLNNYI